MRAIVVLLIGCAIAVAQVPRQGPFSGGGGGGGGTTYSPGTYLTLTGTTFNVDTTKIPTNAAIQAGQLQVINTTSSSSSVYTGVMSANDPLAAYTANAPYWWNVGATGCAPPITLAVDTLAALPVYQGTVGTTNIAAATCAANAVIPLTYDPTTTAFRAPFAGTAAAATSPITLTTGTIACATCVTSAGSLTSGAVMLGAGSQASQVQISAIVTNIGGATETWTFKNPTASTGSTSVVVQAGAGQSGAEFQILNNAGAGALGFTVDGQSVVAGLTANTGGAGRIYLQANSHSLIGSNGNNIQTSNLPLCLGNNSQAYNDPTDTCISRDSAGVIDIGTGAQGSTAGTLQAKSIKSIAGVIVRAGYTVATLPASPGTGAQAYVTDAVACTFLATLTGGSSTWCPVGYNGSAWVGE